MRNATIFILAAALAAAPAAAQNEADVNVDTANATVANEVAPVDANAVMAANEVAMAPVAAPEEPAPAPVVRYRERGFPWGAIGLIGLIGLLGRRRRTD